MCPVCAELSPGENEGFVFIDIVGEPHHNGVKCNAWRAMWFRPIVERKTDISVFKAMLTPAGKKERVS